MFGRAEKTTVRNFKKGLDVDDVRRQREESGISLRKVKREEQLQKRRQTNAGDVANPESAPETPVVSAANMSEIRRLVEAVRSDNRAAQYTAVQSLRKMLSIEQNPPIQAVIDTGVVPRLVEMLTFAHDTNIQFEAAWTLTNIASGSSQQTRTVVSAGAVPHLVQLTRSDNMEVCEQAVWALGNIAGDSAECRDFVLAAGALPNIVALCKPSAKLTLLRNATWTISNLCRGKPQPPLQAVLPAIPKLAELIWATDDEVLVDACWALSYISDDKGSDNNKIKAVVEANICPRLMKLLNHPNPKVRTPALRTAGNIVTGDDRQTQAVLDAGILTYLVPLLRDSKRATRKEACWTVSNITAGTKQQIQMVIEANLFPPLIECLRAGEHEVRKEACWAISNATSGGSPQQIRYLVEQAAIPALCDILTSTTEVKLIMVALEGIENILRHGQEANTTQYTDFVEDCGGLTAIEEIQEHENEDIYDKARSILSKFFETEEAGEDESVTPAVAGDQFAFGVQQQAIPANTVQPFQFNGDTNAAAKPFSF